MSEIFKFCSVAVICAILGVLVKTYRSEFAIHTRITGVIIIYGALIFLLVPVFEYLEGIVGQALPLQYLEILIKALGIAYLTQITSDFCADCGENNLAKAIETAGKVEILILSFPLIETIIGMSEELLSW